MCFWPRLALLSFSFLLSIPALASPFNHYALILQDAPVGTRRGDLSSPDAEPRRQSILSAQAAVRTQLQTAQIQVVGATQSLLNAVFVVATRDQVAALGTIPGVKAVVKMGVRHPNLDAAVKLVNAPAAWTALGGIPNAGLGIKIGIIDTGIDQTHPAFSDTALPSVQPICNGSDCSFTNAKVIVARSYVTQLAAGAQPNPAATSSPDDFSPRDHVGHGTAVAMVAAGYTNTAPNGEVITGLAPKAYLGNYKVYGSSDVNPGATDDVLIMALNDAFDDRMDLVNLSSGSPTISGYGDAGTACDNPAGVACDLVAQTYETAALQGMLIIAAAGNYGFNSAGNAIVAGLGSPASAPDVLSVAASTNSHTFLNGISVAGAGVPSNVQNIAAIFGDGPAPSSPLTAPAQDIATVGDALGCTAPPAASLTGKIALIQRGTCNFVNKVQNAQSAGAVGVIFTLANATDTLISPSGLSNTTIPSLLISQTDGQNLRAYVSSNPQAQITIDPGLLVARPAAANIVSDFSSRGPALISGTVKPDITAVGQDILMATERTDPDGELYSPNGYTAQDGTSFSSPMATGAAALMKQKFPKYTAAQIRSVLVNSANSTALTLDNGSSATPNDSGVGLLDVNTALGATVTVSPISVFFGVLKASAAAPAPVTLLFTNSGTAPVNLALAGTTTITVTPTSLSLAAGQTGSVTVRLPGSVPAAGIYQGRITVTGAPVTMHIAYSYVVGSGTGKYINDLLTDEQIAGVGQDLPDGLAIQVTDASGVPIANSPVRFTASRGASVSDADSATNQYGIAFANGVVGATPGNYTFTATAAGLTYSYQETARLIPAISSTSVVNAASFQAGRGIAPGSYITIYGTGLADGTFVNGAASLQPGLQGVSVSFDVPSAEMSLPAYMYYVSPGQVNVQVPWELAGQTSVQMKVSADGIYGNVVTVPVTTYAPAFFTYGATQAAALDQNSQLIGTANAAHRGQVISIYANGLGPVNNQPASGYAAPSSPLASTQAVPVVTIGGVAATVQYSGLAPNFTGLYQLNVLVPANAPTGTQPLSVTAGGVTSPSVNLNVQ